MPLRRTIHILLLFAPMVLFIFLLFAPAYSPRLSLLLHGHPFARVVPKDQLDVFRFVTTDNLRSRAIVFAGQKPIGWIYQPLSGFARFVPFTGQPEFGFAEAAQTRFADHLSVAWFLRWWLLPLQVLLLLLVRWQKTKLLSA